MIEKRVSFAVKCRVDERRRNTTLQTDLTCRLSETIHATTITEYSGKMSGKGLKKNKDRIKR